MLPCCRSSQTSSPTPATVFPSSCAMANSCSPQARPTSMTRPPSRWSRRGSSASSPSAETTVRWEMLGIVHDVTLLYTHLPTSLSCAQPWSRTWRCGQRWKRARSTVRPAAWGPRLTWTPTTAAWGTPPCSAARTPPTLARETHTSNCFFLLLRQVQRMRGSWGSSLFP